ncbi:MAG: MFS transporter [Acidimicrobiales bacterium]|jgi:MFS family permease|nr:MFS transporter [Acidimicrobiales bacterium]
MTTPPPETDDDDGAPSRLATGTLVVLAATQFLMVLDQAVMNVSISRLVEDFDTTVTVIQGIITLYSLTMAALMITGGKIGDIIGRRRAFAIGMVVYCLGSGLTAVAWSTPVLAFGWSILEGIGAALVLPSLAALVAGNFVGPARRVAYATIGGVAGAGIAVGPILGGWVTTEFTWRWVFAGEVVVGMAILASMRLVRDAPRPGPAPRLDVLGAVLSASGMALVVLGLLKASQWGWLQPKDSPVEPLGFALTPFVVAAGVGVLWGFRGWEARRESSGRDPLVHFALLRRVQLRAGLVSFLAQNTILMGVFFVVPLYLQLVLGLDALETGIKMLPVSVTMFLTSVVGSRLAARVAARVLVRTGFVVITAAALVLSGTIEPTLDDAAFRLGMALLGIGMGLIASQLGNVVQSSVGASDRSEAGGMQYTAQQLGSSLGVALIGAIVLTGLVRTFVVDVQADERISAEVQDAVTVAVEGPVSFVASSDVRQAAEEAGISPAEVDALVEDYEESQLRALETGLLISAFIAAGALLFTGGLPTKVLGGAADGEPAVEDGGAADGQGSTMANPIEN